MTKTLKDGECHVASGRKGEENISICGVDITHDFHFEDPAHAYLSVKAGSRLYPCSDCARIIIDAFKQ